MSHVYSTIYQIGPNHHTFIAVGCGTIDMVGNHHGKEKILHPNDEGFKEMLRSNLEICAKDDPKTFMKIYESVHYEEWMKNLIEEIRKKMCEQYEQTNPFKV